LPKQARRLYHNFPGIHSCVQVALGLAQFFAYCYGFAFYHAELLFVRAILQRHGKIIMTVLGIALMFIFALPTFRGPDTNRSTMAAGTLNGHKVTGDDVDFARAELALLQQLRLFDLSPLYSQAGYVVNMMVPEDSERPVYWYLLCKEASRYGTSYISDADARQRLTDIGYSEADIAKVLHDVGLGPRELGPALSNLENVANYLQFLANLPRPVSAMELSADRELSKLQVAYAILDVGKGWEQAPAPTDEQITKQFNLYKDVIRTPIPPLTPTTTAPSAESPVTPPPPLPPLVDGHNYPFGYKYPDRVAVEYLVFNRAAIRAGMQLTPEDIDNADKYYFSHPEEFRNVAPPTTATAPATAAASQPAATTPAQVAATLPAIKPLKEVQDKLREQQIDARVDVRMKKMVDRVLAQTAEPWKAMPIDDKGYRDLLPRGSWVSYQKVAEDVAKNRDFGGYKPEVHSTGDKAPENLRSAEALGELKGIGSAVYRVSSQQLEFPFPDLATHVRELVDLKARNPLGRLFLQMGIEGQPLQDKDGNVYIYRVTDASKTHVPTTDAEVAEVRPQVIDDLKKLASYQQRETEAKTLAAAANRADLIAIAGQKNLPTRSTQPFSRMDQSGAPEVATIRGFVDAAFALANSAATQPSTGASSQPAFNGPTKALDTDETLRSYVLQVVSQMPATGADFGGHRRTLFQEGDPAVGAFLRDYIGLEPLAARLKYVPSQPFPKPKTDE